MAGNDNNFGGMLAAAMGNAIHYFKTIPARIINFLEELQGSFYYFTNNWETIKGKATLAIKRARFTGKAQLAFLEDFYTLINDGIPANRAIEMLVQATRGLSRDVALAIAQKISEGQPLAEGMREWFNISVVEIIRVGEEGGALAQTVKSAINSMSQSGSATSALISAISYPLMVILMACAIILYLNNSVFVQFAAIKPVDQWPQAGRDLMMVAGLIQNWWWIFIVSVVGFIFIMRRILSNYTGDLRPFLDGFPPFSIYRRFMAARLMETMGLLVANGIVFKQAIKVMEYQASPYLASHLVMMEHILATGAGNISDVLATGLISENDILRLRVMAEVKGFEHGLVRMGVRGTEETTQTMKLIAKVVGGMLLALGGILVLMIVRGIYLTGMSMGSQ